MGIKVSLDEFAVSYLQRLGQGFAKADKNQDGVIDSEEFDLKRVAGSGTEVRWVRMPLSELDSNGSGGIQADEMKQQAKAKVAPFLFASFDANGDGVSELAEFLQGRKAQRELR